MILQLVNFLGCTKPMVLVGLIGLICHLLTMMNLSALVTSFRSVCSCNPEILQRILFRARQKQSNRCRGSCSSLHPLHVSFTTIPIFFACSSSEQCLLWATTIVFKVLLLHDRSFSLLPLFGNADFILRAESDDLSLKDQVVAQLSEKKPAPVPLSVFKPSVKITIPLSDLITLAFSQSALSQILNLYSLSNSIFGIITFCISLILKLLRTIHLS